ncbi:hypothetical protein, partial [Lactococcus petauri]|uniref:hypothetical protein n=1 Tax=Lactococcus petauri TaxID=1940789 RepID=UPI0021F15895
LDKELENGDHTIYTATVNNTGNIMAKSSGYTFTKTAEAVTRLDLPAALNIPDVVEKPGLTNGKSVLVILIGLFMSIGITLILIGLFTKNN